MPGPADSGIVNPPASPAVPMSSRSSTTKARRRIASVFTYLQELHRVRTPPIVDVERYPWRLRLADVPIGPTIEWGQRLAGLGGRANRGASDEFLLRVGRPDDVACPEPPPLVRERLVTGWDSPASAARMRTVPPTVVAEESDAFLQAKARQEAFERWQARREAWVRKQEPLALFLRLYDLWAQFERESEKYQLYFGDGVLVVDEDDDEDGVCHPVLLQRLELRFDPAIPAFTITESEDAPVLYSPMLRHIAVDGRALLALQQEFSEGGCDPLAGEGTDRFLRSLVHGLWPGGALYPDADAAAGAAGPRIYRDPMLYLGRRSQDFAGQIDRYLDVLARDKELPRALQRVVGIDTDEREAATTDDVDLLLTRPANPEQRRVIRRLEETGAVIVQGPPGTGKSHTIANLIGHLLAQNKSILVTSHASKALRVVREQVAGPLQSLCVSVLDSDEESGKQLEESITGILNYFSLTTRADLTREIAELDARRSEMAARVAELTSRLRGAIAREYGDVELDGERVPTAEVVRELVSERGRHDWLPGPIVPGAELPLDQAEVTELYRLVADVMPDDERGQALIVPDLARLPDPDAFAELCNARTRAATTEAVNTASLWKRSDQRVAELDELIGLVGEAGRVFAESEPLAARVPGRLRARGRGGRAVARAARPPARRRRPHPGAPGDGAPARPPGDHRPAPAREPRGRVADRRPRRRRQEAGPGHVDAEAAVAGVPARRPCQRRRPRDGRAVPGHQVPARGRLESAPPWSAAGTDRCRASAPRPAPISARSRRRPRSRTPSQSAAPSSGAASTCAPARSAWSRPAWTGSRSPARCRRHPAHTAVSTRPARSWSDRIPRLLAARRHYATAERLAQSRDIWLTELAAAAERDGGQELVRRPDRRDPQQGEGRLRHVVAEGPSADGHRPVARSPRRAPRPPRAGRAGVVRGAARAPPAPLQRQGARRRRRRGGVELPALGPGDRRAHRDRRQRPPDRGQPAVRRAPDPDRALRREAGLGGPVRPDRPRGAAGARRLARPAQEDRQGLAARTPPA